MLKVTDIKQTSPVNYQGCDYPAIAATITDENGSTYDTILSSESLARAILDTEDCPKDDECRLIDECFYVYLPDNVFLMPKQEIATFIEENID